MASIAVTKNSLSQVSIWEGMLSRRRDPAQQRKEAQEVNGRHAAGSSKSLRQSELVAGAPALVGLCKVLRCVNARIASAGVEHEQLYFA